MNEEEIKSLSKKIKEVNGARYRATDEKVMKDFETLENNLKEEYYKLTGFSFDQIIYYQYNQNTMIYDHRHDEKINFLVECLGGYITEDETQTKTK